MDLQKSEEKLKDLTSVQEKQKVRLSGLQLELSDLMGSMGA
jgi:hypothetical protein